tara:strand:+ start:1759 stop:2187 length:429 start_codon:yes stop_codon:yes gene_type:complete
MKSKAAVAKALNDAGIPLPKEDSYDSMMHRLNTWQAGHGYLFRRMKSRFYAQQKLPAEIPLGTVIWVPNSKFARDLIRTGAMFPMGRTPYDDKYTMIDVPKTEKYTEPVVDKPKPKAKPKKTSKPKSNSKVKADGGNNNSDS